MARPTQLASTSKRSRPGLRACLPAALAAAALTAGACGGDGDATSATPSPPRKPRPVELAVTDDAGGRVVAVRGLATISGTSEPRARILVDRRPVTKADGNGRWSARLRLTPGTNRYTVLALFGERSSEPIPVLIRYRKPKPKPVTPRPCDSGRSGMKLVINSGTVSCEEAGEVAWNSSGPNSASSPPGWDCSRFATTLAGAELTGSEGYSCTRGADRISIHSAGAPQPGQTPEPRPAEPAENPQSPTGCPGEFVPPDEYGNPGYCAGAGE